MIGKNGKCYFCAKKIKMMDEKKIIFKKNIKDKTVKNMAYIHADCKNQIITSIKINDEVSNNVTVKELMETIEYEKTNKKRKSKFQNLLKYFHDTNKNKLTLSFKTIEKILGFKLCDSAYKYKTYFLSKRKGMISEAWISQGFDVENINIEKQTIEFKRVKFKKKINVPDVLYRANLPEEAISEANNFFLHFLEKYRLI